jgi:hypothetical protein
LRNFGFWLNEFQERYRHDLEQDLLGSLGDRGWMLVIPAAEGCLPDVVVVLELERDGAVDGILQDLFSWLREQAWVRSFGTMVPTLTHETTAGHLVRRVLLRTPFGRVPGPNFAITDRFLLFAGGPEALAAGETWVRSLELSGPTEAVPDDGHPIHGSLVVDGRELARLLAAASDLPDGLPRCIVPGLAAALGLTDTIRIDVRYEPDALRVSGRIQFAEGPK